MGQLAMAIDHGGRQTMPTGGARSSIGGRSSETQVEAVMGAWTVRSLYQEPKGVGEASEGGKMVCHFPVRLQLKVLHKVLRAATLRNVEFFLKLAFSLGHPWSDERG